MDLLTVFMFAVGLCFDSFAVSLSCGMSRCTYTTARGIRFATVLALMQALMPLAGWLLASNFHKTIEDYDHWIAFILLCFLGGKMIKESFCTDCDDEVLSKGDPFTLKRSMVLGIATSIDALIAGVAMALIPISIVDASQLINILVAILIIGVVTFLASGTGLLIGRRTRSKLGSRSELIGGLILIAIGIKVLIEHLS